MKKLLAMLLALVMVLSMLTVVAFAEGTPNEEEGEEVTEPADEVNAPEDDDNNAGTTGATGADANPGTGIALAGLPVVIAAAAAVVSKKH